MDMIHVIEANMEANKYYHVFHIEYYHENVPNDLPMFIAMFTHSH